MPNTTKKLDALIFIDTNIFLDFYRIRKSDVSLKYLKEIETHKDLIITTSQVEMEFKKNRQAVVLESISEVNKISDKSINVPTILSGAKATQMINKSLKDVNAQKKKLKEQFERILKEPNKYDPVFKSLQRVFKHQSNINLNRELNQRFAIRKLAIKRFLLGYPPRKKSDNSIGDAINWEWIVKCAQDTGKSIILVTRDKDFGTVYNNEPYLDDWLKQEFKQRVSQRRKLVLTDKLSAAFKLVEIPVTEEMIQEEKNVIDLSSLKYTRHTINEALKKLQGTIDNSYYRNYLSHFNKSMSYTPINEILRRMNLDDLPNDEES